MRSDSALKSFFPAGVSHTNLRQGLNELRTQDGQLFYLFVPAKAMIRPEASRILVSVHGYSGRKNNQRGRNLVKKYAEYWSGVSEEKGWVVLAPHFDEKRFKNDYQRVNRAGLPADVRLNELAEVVGRLLPGVPIDKMFLFGFSGGGQFVHRYVAFHPGRIIRAVAAAPGWYMWPVSLPYPVGVNMDGLPSTGNRLLRGLCSANILILVGEKDATQGAFRRRFGDYDLTQTQGNGRKERAVNWIASMKAWAKANGCPFNVAFSVVAKAAHSMNNRFLDYAKDYLCVGLDLILPK